MSENDFSSVFDYNPINRKNSTGDESDLTMKQLKSMWMRLVEALEMMALT